MLVLTRQQLALLAALTLIWGLNWPVMKLGVTNFPPLSFRALSLCLGVPVLALGLVWLRVPFGVPRVSWPELFRLSIFNMFIWHGTMILAVKHLSSGRAAILGYTMPIFSAIFGALWFSGQLSARSWLGVAAAALGVLLLLWHELTGFAGRPEGVLLALVAASTWALGTQMLRHTRINAPTLALSFWMTAMTSVVMLGLALVFERDQWHWPDATTWGAVLYNAVLIFGFAHAVWFYLARALLPVASTLSVMLIPVLGVFSGAWWLNEALHWQDWAAVGLMMAAIASVLLPKR